MNEQERVQLSRYAIAAGLAGNAVLTLLKGSVGVLTGSTAIIADAFHSASDVLSTLVAMGGVKLAHQPPDKHHHYGHAKAEPIAAKILALILIFTAAGIGWKAIQVAQSGNIVVPGTVAIYAVILSIVIKEGMYHYTVRIGRKIKSSVIVADAWHHRSDAFSSIAALIGVLGANFGYPILDPLAGIIVAIMILRMGINVYWSAIKELMDPAPKPEVIEQISEIVKNTEGVRSVEEIKARYNGPYIYVDLKICVHPQVTVEKGHAIAAAAKYNILEKDSTVKDVLIHVNPCFYSELSGECDCKRKKQEK
ncbi:cation diffusion facilitator family transporter [Desulfitispora alkaliphila]|uniref:cation diffusion facilitator family transporter n=1 Tax=Desulfitispora alkaliphila TaxID=622674 RepID=UPI003D1984B7